MRKTLERSGVATMVLTAMMMCMVVVMTMIIRIPIPATQGYIHLGDCMIFFSVLLQNVMQDFIATQHFKGGVFRYCCSSRASLMNGIAL